MDIRSFFITGIFCGFIFLAQALAAPTIQFVTPSINALNIATDTDITIVFNTDMNASTITNRTVFINGSLSGLHTGDFTYNANTRTAKATLNSTFRIGEVVTVTVTRGIKDTNGDALASGFSWEFTIRNNPGTGFFQLSSSINVGISPWCMAAGDFNKDGTIDLATVNNHGNSVSILTNNGNGSFLPASTIYVGNYPGSIISADLNRDGSMDLAITNGGSNTISILINDGRGGFSQTIIASGGNIPWDLTAADIDGDGDLDLSVLNNSSNRVTILKNNGFGTFTFSSAVNGIISPYSVTKADWNGDGKLDLAVTNMGASTVTILRNDGNGSFMVNSTIPVGNGPLSATAMDIDGDGAMDLAISNFDSRTITLLKNDGKGIFFAESPISVGATFKSAADIDGDGDLDIISPYVETIAVLQNEGNWKFLKISELSAGSGTSTRMILAADFNNDGLIDLAGANLQTNTVSIFTALPINQHPVADAGPDQTVDLGTPVLLDGSASYDPDGDIKTYIWKEDTTKLSATEKIDLVLPLGVHYMVLNVVDDKGAADCDTVVVTVTNSKPPIIIVSCTPLILWPPNHKYVTVTVPSIVIAVNDASGNPIPTTNVHIKSVSSDEPETSPGDGNTKNDILIAQDASSVNLRAERQGGGNGRVYTLTLFAKDISGNIGTAIYEVWVPNSQHDKIVINDGPAYTVEADGIIALTKNELFNNYPNPFNPSTEICFTINKEDFVSLKVYDIIGREVATLMNEWLPSGVYSVNFDASGLSSGTYFYRLTTGASVSTKKMILTK